MGEPSVKIIENDRYREDTNILSLTLALDGRIAPFTVLEADIILDDGSGDSPAVRFVGGSHNDEARIFLVDDGTAGDSDLAVRLCDAAGDSRFIIQTNAGAEIAHVDSLGGASFQAGMVVNESGDDHDSRVEGATLVNLIYVDAGADRVYVNSAAGDANVTGFDSNVRVLVFDNLAVSREGPAYVSAFTYSNTGTDVTAFRGRRARGTRASPATPQSGDRLVRFGGAGYDGSNFLSSNAYFDMYAAENFSGTNQGAEIRAYTTANGSTVPLERMRWADDGNVGLNETTPSWGVASPERTFHLSYSGDRFPALVLERTNGSSYTNRKFSWYVGSSGALTLYDHTGSAVRWVVEAGGNVGIGSSDPDTRLDVNGAITFRELSSDPSDPDEGCAVLWRGDGGGTGDDGDILLKITTGGSTKTTTLVDFSAI